MNTECDSPVKPKGGMALKGGPELHPGHAS